MSPSTNTAPSLSATPTPSPSPAELSDAELLAATRGLVGRSNQLLAALLAHLGEVDARGIHRTRACSSLYAYCIYELRFSEDEAFRRVAAARLVRRFPALWDAIAAGELHLTGLLMLGPHLTEENVSEVLLRARHRTKREIARLVRQLDPLPDVPARIEPLGPALARVAPSEPTWDEFVRSLRPVRELAPGERPRDWTANANDVETETALPTEPQAHAPPGGADLAAPLSSQRYRVQFTAGEEYVKLVEEARALLSHSAPRATLDEIQLRAMRALVAALKRQKYAVTARPQNRRAAETPTKPADPSSSTAVLEGEKTPWAEAAQKFGTERETDAVAEREAGTESESARRSKTEPQHPRRRGRHIPASVRRAVFERDEGRCTYADGSGRRCAETHGLEFHHLIPFAQGGEHTEANLALRCRSHNALAAEEDFGRALIELARSAGDHEPWAAQPGS
jgi:5-methylcytosine-specific restriction endonuclease McrA